MIKAFSEMYKDTYFFIEEYNCWAVFDGKKWELDAYHLLYEKLFNTLCETYPNGSSNDDLLIKRSISILQNISEYRRSSVIFDTHPELFNCQNGVYNLETKIFIEHQNNQTKDLYLTKISNVDYNPDAKCPRFSQFLEEIFAKYNDVSGIIDYIQATYGYLISGYTQNQSFYFYHGAGANGKTTLIAIISLRGRKCECCGLTEWLNKPINLEIHHIDGNHNNNELENIQLLCPNCHSYTNNYRGKNANTGKIKVSEEDFVQALQNSNSIAQTLKKLGLSLGSGNYKRANELIVKYQIVKFLI